MPHDRKIKILSDSELEDLYGFPILELEDRTNLFDVDETDRVNLDKIVPIPAKINYLLQKGYFYAKQTFFQFTFQNVREDTWFIINNYFPHEQFPKKQISKYFHYANQKLILERFNFIQSTNKEKHKLIQHAKDLAKRHSYPKFIFNELVAFCQRNNWVKPAYSTLQAIVSQAIVNERKRLLRKVSSLFDKNIQTTIDSLLSNEEKFYRLTLLKKSAKDFSTHEIRNEITKQQYLLGLHKNTGTLLLQLGISNKNIEYYASLATFYTIPKLKRFNRNLARLYLLCYVYHRLLEINDNLTTYFIHYVNKYYQDAEDFANEQIIANNLQSEKLLNNAGQLARLYANRSITDNNLRLEAFKIVPEDNIEELAKQLTKPDEKRIYFIWNYLGKRNNCFKINLRPLFLSIKFSYVNDLPIKEAVEFFHHHLINHNSFNDYEIEEIPIRFIPESLHPHVITKKIDPKDNRKRIKTINGDCYEYMLYLYLRRMITSGQVFVKDSISYRHLEDELIPYDQWMANKSKIINLINFPLLRIPIKKILATLSNQLTATYIETNANISNGNNKHIKLQKDKKNVIHWRLPYRKQEDEVNNPFYKNLPSINISDLIRYVANETQFYKKITNIHPRYIKNTFDLDQLVAAVIAGGTGIGINTMAEISDVGFHQLNNFFLSCFRIDTLRSANNEVINKIAQLPIFKFYTLAEYGIHASIDGQKVETRSHTIKARYSKKYFGLGKGASSLKLVANHVPTNDKIIGTNNHESHYAVDIVMGNTSEIQITAVSGDMHSINRVNFALMYLFGYRFMPRFTSLHEKTKTLLVCSQNPEEFDHYLIKPSSKVKDALIIKEWDNILRILASLAMKETSQSIIVQKLSSYKNTNPTLKALIEFDKIIMSLYLLEYVDDVDMRKNVHRSLNRGESLHQLITAIRKVSDNKLPGKNEYELNVYNECNRLIANCIIYYNSKLLSNLLDTFLSLNMKENCNLIKRLSPVAWQHINLMGKYEFCNNQQTIDIQNIIQTIISENKINLNMQLVNY